MVVKNNNSGVSIAMSETISSLENGSPIKEKKIPTNFTIKIANSLQEREDVFRLGYQVYFEKGYIKQNYQEWLIQSYDANSETVILMVQDQNKEIAGSLTLVFSESMKLPAERIYGEEIKGYQAKGEKMVEVSRLVISHEYRNSKEVLLLLINYLMIYCYHEKKYSSLIIEVNPRHKNYYKSLLNFDEVGGEKACPNVQNAPAVLLHLPLSRYQSEVTRCANNPDQNKKERSLYPYFLKPEQESLVIYYLNKQVKPMSEEEKHHFGFTEFNNRMAAVV
jgi:N-acyl-L-homoserine lactone synthetase